MTKTICFISSFSFRNCFGFRTSVFGFSFLRCFLDGSDDFVIAGAAAEIIGKIKPNFMFARVRIFVEQGLGGYEKAWRTNTALQSGAFEETFLNFLQVSATREALDRFDLRAVGLNSQHDAAIDRYTVHDHGAGAAVAVIATFFGAGQSQVLAEHFQQAVAGLAQKLRYFAVDRGRYMMFLRHVSFLVLLKLFVIPALAGAFTSSFATASRAELRTLFTFLAGRVGRLWRAFVESKLRPGAGGTPAFRACRGSA